MMNGIVLLFVLIQLSSPLSRANPVSTFKIEIIKIGICVKSCHIAFDLLRKATY